MATPPRCTAVVAATVGGAMLVALACLSGCGGQAGDTLAEEGLAAEVTDGPYDLGAIVVTDLWVDPAHGSDAHTGRSRAQAFRTLNAAWDHIPSGATLTGTGYRINLVAGRYPKTSVPGYLEQRRGTKQFPIIIQAVDGRGTARLDSDLNFYQCRYINLIDFNVIPVPAGNALHNEQVEHFLMRGMVLSGGSRQAQETVKMNQCRYVYVEECDISGGWNCALDFVAVQYGHILKSRMHNAGDWAAYLKGGSSYFRIEGNEFYDADNGGFTAGQGTSFEFMVSPWLHYETYDIKVVNNVIHDTAGAGLGVNGGYNILLAYNTLYRCGRSSHAIEIVFGARGCGGNLARCRQYLSLGGWGTAHTGAEEPIPDRNVYVVNNLLYNPPGYRSQWSHFSIMGPRHPSAGSNIPSPSRTDTDLVIRGNLLWNGPKNLPLGVEDPAQGCQPSNPTCHETQLRAQNTINKIQPQLTNPGGGNFRPKAGGNVLSVHTYTPPSFTWSDAPKRPHVPAGNLSNAVTKNRDGAPRSSPDHPGAY